jgi:hypothetical protein
MLTLDEAVCMQLRFLQDLDEMGRSKFASSTNPYMIDLNQVYIYHDNSMSNFFSNGFFVSCEL